MGNAKESIVVGLDRDGVINRDLFTYVTHPDDFDPIDGSLEAIVKLYNLGYKIVVITNQGGIEQGIMTFEDVDSVHRRMRYLLEKLGCPKIDGIYTSASNRKDDPYAKPNIGMFRHCERENPHFKFRDGYFVGDKISDLKAAISIGATPVLVRTGYGADTEQELEKSDHRDIREKTIVFDNLSNFVNWLEAQD